MKTIGRWAMVISLLAGMEVRSWAEPRDAALPVKELGGKRPEGPCCDDGSPASNLRCKYLITVANDYIVDAYKNGKLVPDAQRELLLDRFGATVEKIHVEVRAGDWLVFHVVHNHLRWGGTKYFAVAGCFGRNEFGFVSSPESKHWSACDDPAEANLFIKDRLRGTEVRASLIKNPWSEGDSDMKSTAGAGFTGKPLWGGAPSTWIKYVADEPADKPMQRAVAKPVPVAPPAPSPSPVQPLPMQAKRWPVQILSAVYGTGGKNADVTARVKEHVEAFHRPFSVNPEDLGADPNPYWNKGLHIVYMKDGVVIILVNPEKARDTKVDLDLDNVSVADAVKYLAIAAGLEMTRDGEAIVLKSK